MAKVFITGLIEEKGIELLKKHQIDVVCNLESDRLTKAHMMEIFKEYDGVICTVNDRIDAEVIKAASNKFKIISNYSVGFDNVDVLAAKRHGIMVTNTPGVAGESVAEHTFALILACSKRIVEADRYVRAGKFLKWDPRLFMAPQIWGKKIGIVGLGRIGTFVGNIAFNGFRMEVFYFDHSPSEDFEMLVEAKFLHLPKLLQTVDIVSINVPLNANTHHLIGKNELGHMKESAILVNTSRGAVVDQEALIEALKEKKIKAAGLDVFEDDFNIPHELKTLGNVVLTPHVASATSETREAMSYLAAQNVIDVFNGREPNGLIKVE